ncbi:hypothetical protein OCAR_6656 [Afipia carboxidovorans OM5]|nr:hypothetical protein OCAR_6656 [Afipia carboxidovorans OM5]
MSRAGRRGQARKPLFPASEGGIATGPNNFTGQFAQAGSGQYDCPAGCGIRRVRGRGD